MKVQHLLFMVGFVAVGCDHPRQPENAPTPSENLAPVAAPVTASANIEPTASAQPLAPEPPLSPDGETLQARAFDMMIANNLPGAERLLLQALAREPHSRLWHDLGRVYSLWATSVRETAGWEQVGIKAVEAYRRSIAILPSDTAYLNLAAALVELGKYQDAEAALRHGMALGTGTMQHRKELALLAQVVHAQGRYGDALRIYDQAIRAHDGKLTPGQQNLPAEQRIADGELGKLASFRELAQNHEPLPDLFWR